MDVRRRTLYLFVTLAVLIAPVAAADDGSSPPPSEPPPATEPPPSTPPPGNSLLIPDGVMIGSVAVGGMTVEQARAAVQAAFDTPVEFEHGTKRWTVLPGLLGGKPYVDGAVQRALVAPPGGVVELVVDVKGKVVRDYIDDLVAAFGRQAKDATLRLVKLRPRIMDGHAGLAVLRNPMIATIVHALRSGDRGPLELASKVLLPKVTRAKLAGPVIVIRRASNKLFLYKGQRNWRVFGVATGQAAYPTPLGRWQIVEKQRNPWWYPPPSPWAQGEQAIPPGPGNPLGTRWMGLSAPAVGIHGTPDAASIGYSASHGCIRMHIPDAEWLFDHVKVGTPVFIVAA
jgi:lipoprotein-anchoring transpeptidase ErfK/SrfK